MNKLDRLAVLVGRGLVAGLLGTAAMTISSTLEMKVRDREPSDAPSRAAGKVIGVQPRNPEGAERFGNMVHWGYGSAWGIPAALLATLIPSGLFAAGMHYASIWGTELAMLPALGVAPEVGKWGPEEVAIDGWHHLVYAAAVGGALRFMKSP